MKASQILRTFAKQTGFSLLISALMVSLLTAISIPKANAADFWTSCNSGLQYTSATYVTVDSTVTGKCIITFKLGQTFTLPVGVIAIEEALVVGGGGGGGFGNNGGGGGAGLVQYRNTTLNLMAPTQTVSTTQLVINIGTGGDDGWVSASSWRKGDNGNPTTISNQSGTVIIRAGGGGGGCGNNGVNTGYEGSAGGACTADTSAKAAGTVAVTPGWTKYANSGGSGNAAGGGGAGAAPLTATRTVGGNGVTLFGLSVGGGGGGWSGSATNGGSGGGGGAINGNYLAPNADTATGSDGWANTGGGGGAARKGGSGVVKIAYLIPTVQAPTSVSVTAQAQALTVNWAAPANWPSPANLGQSAVTGYQVEYSTTGLAGSWTIASSSVAAGATSFQITGLIVQRAYFVRVAAKFSGGLGAYGYPWTPIYETVTPYRTSGLITYTSGFGLTGGAATTNSATAFSRIRYVMAATYNSAARYVDANFYKALASQSSSSQTFDSISKLQVPTTSGSGSQFVIQGNISDLTILSNTSEVQNGNGFTGRLEIWPWDYGTASANDQVQRTANTYDDSDVPTLGNTYGSFQLHNLSSTTKQTVFAWNNHGQTANYEIGFGNPSTGTHSDWTFCSPNQQNYCSSRSAFSLGVFINAPTSTLAGPTITSLSVITGATTGGTATVITGTNLTGTSGVTVGGVAATLGSVTSTTVAITTPAGTVGEKDVVLTTPAGSVTKTNGFTYTRANQSSISIATRFGTGGFPLSLAIQGGSGTGALTYTLDPAIQSSCVLTGSTLTPNFGTGISGTCYVKAVRAQDQAFFESSSETTAIFFTAYVPVVEQTMTCPPGTTPSVPTGIGVGSCIQVLAPVSPLAGDSGAAPKITSLSATSGLVGATITITGTGLSTVTRVQFGTKSTTEFTKTATTITVNVPVGATRGRVMAVSPTGTALAPEIFTVTVG